MVLLFFLVIATFQDCLSTFPPLFQDAQPVCPLFSTVPSESEAVLLFSPSRRPFGRLFRTLRAAGVGRRGTTLSLMPRTPFFFSTSISWGGPDLCAPDTGFPLRPMGGVSCGVRWWVRFPLNMLTRATRMRADFAHPF